jgi:lysophospholipase L1-like esterase
MPIASLKPSIMPTVFSLNPSVQPIASLMPTVSSLKQYLDFGNKQYVELIGRYDSVRADWSGSAVRVSVSVSSVQPCTIQLSFVSLPTNKFYITVLIDGQEFSTVFIDSTHLTATVSPVLTTGVAHEIVFVKRTDYTTGIMQLDQLWIRDATIVSLPKKPLFLFLGDGITNGYGVDGIAGTTPYCNADFTNQNVGHAYPSFVSSFFGANYHSLAITPAGVVRNYGGYNPKNTFLSYFNNTLVSVGNIFYNFTSVSPQLVFVMLGTNDYSTAPVPSNSSFVQGFQTLLQQIKSLYPHSIVVSSCSPLFSSYQCINIQKASTIENVPFVAVSSSIMAGGYGCSYLPNAASQKNIANIIVPFLQKLFSTASPSVMPTPVPSSSKPSVMPTPVPSSAKPSVSATPSVMPVASPIPTKTPISSFAPTNPPSTKKPTKIPLTKKPTYTPTIKPTKMPTSSATLMPTISNKQNSESLTEKKYMVIWLPPIGLFFLVCFCVMAYYAKKRCTNPKHSFRVKIPPQNRMSLEQNFTTV